MKILYTTTVTARNGRSGEAQSDDGLLRVRLSMPKELGGSGLATNPEQLFAAGYAACFENAVIHVARQRKLPVTSTWVRSSISMGVREDGAFGLTASLEVHLEALDEAEAQAVIAEADRLCPYSNAIRGNVEKTIRRV